jgi:flagellar protein FliO/FliZ
VPFDTDGPASLSLTLGLVVMAGVAALWLLKRWRPNSAWLGGDCAVLRSLALGPRERLVVVRIGAKQLVVGVGAGSVSLLCELEEPLPPSPAGSDRFAALLGRTART